MTWSNWLRSAFTNHRSRPETIFRSMFSPMRRVSMIETSLNCSPSSSTSGCKRLTAREGQQLPHQAGGPVGVLLDVHDVLVGGIRRPMRLQQQVGEADDGGQHVVEVMRYATRQLAHRLHLLALGDI